jgi:hypothetical protein
MVRNVTNSDRKNFFLTFLTPKYFSKCFEAFSSSLDGKSLVLRYNFCTSRSSRITAGFLNSLATNAPTIYGIFTRTNNDPDKFSQFLE